MATRDGPSPEALSSAIAIALRSGSRTLEQISRDITIGGRRLNINELQIQANYLEQQSVISSEGSKYSLTPTFASSTGL